MKIFAAKEKFTGENRAALTPQIVQRFSDLGAEVMVESGLGEGILASDESYEKAGAKVVPAGDSSAIQEAGIVLRLRKPSEEDLTALKPGTIHVSFLDPFNEQALVKRAAQLKVTAVSMEFIPRTSVAQKMDALSSQANLAGYAAVIVGAERLHRVLPMMMTPAGTIPPSRVFVIGVGVAGLQAIATAKRLGARVDAFDTRPVVEEQVKSLGARFLKIDLGETGEADQGYAKELTPEQIEKQREGQAKQCEISDLVITTAQVFGRKAPILLTEDMVKRMKPGSVVVDLAVESGGNVEPSRLNEEVMVNGVRVVGLGNLPGTVALDASNMYASNLFAFVSHFWDKEAKTFQLKLEDEILQSAVITHDGAVHNERIREHYEKNPDSSPAPEPEPEKPSQDNPAPPRESTPSPATSPQTLSFPAVTHSRPDDEDVDEDEARALDEGMPAHDDLTEAVGAASPPSPPDSGDFLIRNDSPEDDESEAKENKNGDSSTTS